MPGLFVRLVPTTLLVLGSGLAWAADPIPAETLPSPRPLPAEVILPPGEFPPPPLITRTNRYDVWQYYAVDRQGYFRPRVAYSPYGSYYLYNGKPYFYLPVRNMDFMPYIVDGPANLGN